MLSRPPHERRVFLRLIFNSIKTEGGGKMVIRLKKLLCIVLGIALVILGLLFLLYAFTNPHAASMGML